MSSDVWRWNCNCVGSETITHLRATYANCRIRKSLPIQTPQHNVHNNDGFYDNCGLISSVWILENNLVILSAINSVLAGAQRRARN